MKSKKKKNICGDKIRELRNAMGLEQADFGALISVEYGWALDQSNVSEIELGKRGIKDSELKILADVFKVSADVLLGRK